jgi:hypothetical protein
MNLWVAGLAVAAGVATALVQAQAAVTMELRNGDRVPVMLVDLKADGFEVTVRGETRMIPKDQVAMVDFGASVTVPASALDRMTALDHLVVFRNGDTLLGEWLDVGGTSPLRLTFRTAGGERDIQSNEVARIYLTKARISAQPTTDDDVRGGMQEDGSIAVLASQPFTDTGMTVRTGEMLRFEVSRRIRIGTGDDDSVTADGIANSAGRAVPRVLPVRIMPMGGLIGRVGAGQPFAIGTAPQPIRMPANGRLWLGINDVGFDDNSGWFRVVVRR